MKKKAKAAAAMMSIFMMGGAVLGCSDNTTDTSGKKDPNKGTAGQVNAIGFPIVKEPITLKMFGRRSAQNGPWKDMLVWKEYEKMTNVKVEFEDAGDQGFAEKRNLLIATNELPDAFIRSDLTTVDALKNGKAGLLIPMEGLIDKYAPNIKKLFDQNPEVKKALTAPDGHIYALSDIVTLESARLGLKPWINKEWLQKLNMKSPTTSDELIEVLKAFRDKDPNGNGKPDEIPLAASSIADLINAVSGSWGLERQMSYSINVKNDKVHIWLADEENKQMLQFLRKLYEEKLLDNEIFTQNYAKYISKINSGNTGMFYIQETGPFSSVANSYSGMVPFKGPKGDQLVSAISPIARSYGVFAITNVNKYPEATMRWVDHFYGDEGSIFFRYGMEGKTFVKKPDGSVEYTDDILNDKRGSSVAIGQFTIYPGGGAPQWINDKNSSGINPPQVQEAANMLKPFMPKVVLGPPLFEDATRESVEKLKGDLDRYVAESNAKFITGSTGFDKWDEYLATLKKLKVDELEKLYQQAYDAINKK